MLFIEVLIELKPSLTLGEGLPIIALLINIYLFYLNKRATIQSSINQRLAEIQKIAIDKPYLEDENFIKNWEVFIFFYKDNTTKIKMNDNYKKFMIYEQYCEMIYNLIHTQYEHCFGDIKKMNQNIAFKEWVIQHKLWFKESIYSSKNQQDIFDDFEMIINYWIDYKGNSLFYQFLMRVRLTRLFLFYFYKIKNVFVKFVLWCKRNKK